MCYKHFMPCASWLMDVFIVLQDAHEFLYSLVVAMEGIQLAEAGGKERYDAR